MPWDSSPLVGYTTSRPWLPLGQDHASLNVVNLEQDPESILHLYRALITLRKSHPVLVTGELHSIAAANGLGCKQYGTEGDGMEYQSKTPGKSEIRTIQPGSPKLPYSR
jgi:glycosidase